jgi:hypothetical protein
MPIYAATMGGKMVIGVSLLPATKQAIVAAFGAEGTEVIAKTNDYLNRIALTDPQRALQISGFINEDPLLVCSLVETSKTRWLVGDGKAYVDTGVIPTDATLYEIVGSINPTSNSSLLGLHIGSNIYNYIAGYLTNAQFKGFVVNWGTGTHFQEAGVKDANLHRHKFDRITGEYNVDDNSVILTVGATASTDTLKLFANSPYNNRCSGNVVECKMSNGTTPIREMYPFIRNGENGMLDIISGTFHPNANTAGEFTIAITDKA